jgi:hypothetical protein
MREKWPFVFLTKLPEELRLSALAEAEQLPDYIVSQLAILSDNRSYRALTQSKHWQHSATKSTANSEAIGTFNRLISQTSVSALWEIIKLVQDKVNPNPKSIGSIYVSKMEIGGSVLPHFDGGQYYNLYHRVQVCLNADNAEFICGGQKKVMLPGECWIFDNTRMHSINPIANTPRFALVVDVLDEKHN